MSGSRHIAAFAILLALSLSATICVACLGPRTMYARMAIAPYRDPAPQELAELEMIAAGRKVSVLKREDSWVSVSADGATGWLPAWYLSEKPDVRAISVPPEPCLKVVLSPRAVAVLYPEDGAPQVAALDAGRVLKVTAEYGDWRYVRITAYSIPNVLRGWVPKSVLAAPGETEASEGKILAGTIAYTGEPDGTDFSGVPTEQVDHDMPVRVLLRAGVMTYVQAAGGWSAWVPAKNIVWNPFIE